MLFSSDMSSCFRNVMWNQKSVCCRLSAEERRYRPRHIIDQRDHLRVVHPLCPDDANGPADISDLVLRTDDAEVAQFFFFIFRPDRYRNIPLTRLFLFKNM